MVKSFAFTKSTLYVHVYSVISMFDLNTNVTIKSVPHINL